MLVMLANDRLEDLSWNISFGIWEKRDAGHTVVRIATSWATRKEDVDELISLL